MFYGQRVGDDVQRLICAAQSSQRGSEAGHNCWDHGVDFVVTASLRRAFEYLERRTRLVVSQLIPRPDGLDHCPRVGMPEFLGQCLPFPNEKFGLTELAERDARV
jgi:hypothetical protein